MSPARRHAKRQLRKPWPGSVSCSLMVNNVGIVYPVDDFSMDVPDYDRIISVNLRGQFLMLKYSIPEIIKAGRWIDRAELLDGSDPRRWRDLRSEAKRRSI